MTKLSAKQKQKQKLLFLQFVGNLLMLIPILVLLYVYYPLLFVYVNPPKIKESPQVGIFIEIPKINAQAPIIENVNPWIESEYQKELQKGVAHAKGTSKVGSTNGTIFLFAHSSDLPWRITRQNSAFYKLGDLKKNDTIYLIKDGKKFEYYVADKKTVWPNEIEYLKDTKKTQLILQTCTPIGTSLQRLLIFANPKFDKKT